MFHTHQDFNNTRTQVQDLATVVAKDFAQKEKHSAADYRTQVFFHMIPVEGPVLSVYVYNTKLQAMTAWFLSDAVHQATWPMIDPEMFFGLEVCTFYAKSGKACRQRQNTTHLQLEKCRYKHECVRLSHD
jgi:hypothetical protein